MYLLSLFGVCLLIGVIGVAANPSPYFGVVSLIIGVVGGCGVLVLLGESFVGVVLFLIYLGGMLVVFAYSVALAADSFPETCGSYFVGVRVVGFGLLAMFVAWLLWDVGFYGVGLSGLDSGGFDGLRGDSSGVVVLFSSGGPFLLLCGWGLLVTLFVVLELVRGWARVG